MKIAKRPRTYLEDEALLAVVPTPAQDVDADWLRRTSAFQGRSLSHLALGADQEHRAGHLALAAQLFTPGVARGLLVQIEPSSDAVPTSARVHVAPGSAVTRTGEPLALRGELVVPLADIPRWPSGELLGAGASSATGILALEPVFYESRLGDDPTDPCEDDPRDEAFVDRTHVDAALLWWVDWPTTVALPPDGERLRNGLAAAMFDAERRGEVLPWDDLGVAVALVAWRPGVAPFVDMATVARLARPRGRAPRLEALPPALTEARLTQFAQELAETPVDAIIQHGLVVRFRHLPPFGQLPTDALIVRPPDAKVATNLVPPSWTMRVLPVELEALGEALHASRALAPFDLDAPNDHIDVLVPVPTELYDPDLLRLEVRDPAFDVALAQFRTTLRSLLRSRGEAGSADGVRGEIDGMSRVLFGKPATFEEIALPDLLLIDPAPAPAPFVRQWPAFIDELRTLRERIEAAMPGGSAMFFTPVVPTEPQTEGDVPGDLGGVGFDAIASKASHGLDRVDDEIDSLFIRAHADAHRIRQEIGGRADAPRFTGSPVLAGLAKQIITKPSTTAVTQFAAQLAKVVDRPRDRPDPAGPFDGPRVLDVPAATLPPRIPRIPRIPRVVAPVAAPLTEARIALRRRPFSSTLLSALSKLDLDGDLSPPPPLHFGGLTLADRFKDPPQSVAYQHALGTKAAVARLATQLHTEARLDLKSTSFVGFAPPSDDHPTTIEEMIERRLADEVASGKFDPVPASLEPTAVYGAATRAVENALANLRILEGRLAQARRALLEVAESREEIRTLLEAADVELSRLDAEIEEAAQDVRVAEALIVEEDERVESTNDRRDSIVAEHVPYLVFRRPRMIDRTRAVPGFALEALGLSSEVPACLSHAEEAPEQLREMVDLVRDAPSKWLVAVPRVLARVDRLESLHQTLLHALLRARTPIPTVRAPFQGGFIGSITGQRIAGVFNAQSTIVSAGRIERASRDLALPLPATWTGAHALALEVVTLGDLIEARHGRADAARAAATELESLHRVAACLCARFAEVPPVHRLAWAERYGQFDATPDLSSLAILPRWPELERRDRHDLQELVDWLFSRFDPAVAAARNLANDFVRVALLLASHAPVTQILDAEIEGTPSTSAGGTVRVRVDLERVRIGMPVTLLSVDRRAIGQAVVRDLDAGVAVLTVVRAASPRIDPRRALIGDPASALRMALA